ncbi:MAG: hypothetical protein ACRD1H_16755, partial [Vicinamibacterales bacterium]
MSAVPGRPVAHPVAWSSDRTSSQASGANDVFPSPQLRHSATSSPRARRDRSRREAAIGESLS